MKKETVFVSLRFTKPGAPSKRYTEDVILMMSQG